MYVFFILPLFLSMGVFLQSFGIGFFALIIPGFLLYRQSQYDSKYKNIFKIAIALLIIYAVFPLSSIINYLFLKPETYSFETYTTQNLFKTSKLFSSRISGGIFGTGVVLLLISYFYRAKKTLTAPTTDEPHLPERLLQYFSLGSLLASFTLFLYAAFQHFTGFDYRLPGNIMPATNLMNDGRYRAMGLYGHPLSLAGSALTLFCFFYSLVWSNLSKSFASIQFTAIYLVIACLQICIIFLSGSRFAAMVAFTYLLALPLFSKLPKKAQKYRKWFLLICAVLVPCLGYLTGIFKRFKEINLSTDLTSVIGERAIFWKVHWQMFLDSPLWGQGYAFITQFLRTHYYNEMGFHDLERKYNAHNSYLEILACAGIIGLAVIICAGFFFLRQLYLYSKDHPISSILYQCFLISLSSNAMNAITQNTFFDATITYQYISIFMIVIWASRYGSSNVPT